MAAITSTDNTELHVNVEAGALWSEGNMGVLDEYYAEDFVYHRGDGTEYDLAGYREHAEAFRTAFPDGHVETYETVLDGDVTVVRFTYSGTWEGEFMGTEPNGSTFAVDGISMARIEDGRFAEIWRSVDNAGMLAQLGIIDLPA
jgi:predicted ester cyclase